MDSVLNQNADVEYIFVDPGSTDGSLEIAASYKARLTHSIIGRDNGPADALNIGLRYATGDVFYYLNADDILLDGALQFVERMFLREPIDILCGGGYVLNENSGRLKPVYVRNYSPRRYALGIDVPFQQASFFRMSSIGDARFNTMNTTSWDGEFMLDMALGGATVGVHNVALGGFRLHSASITGSGRHASQYEDDRKRLFHKVYARAPKERDRIAKIIGLVGQRIAARPLQHVGPRPVHWMGIESG